MRYFEPVSLLELIAKAFEWHEKITHFKENFSGGNCKNASKTA